jgi:hypothetical protein
MLSVQWNPLGAAHRARSLYPLQERTGPPWQGAGLLSLDRAWWSELGGILRQSHRRGSAPQYPLCWLPLSRTNFQSFHHGYIGPRVWPLPV